MKAILESKRGENLEYHTSDLETFKRKEGELRENTYDCVRSKGIEGRAWRSCCSVKLEIVSASILLAFH
jgi:hypothetical protein